MLYWHNQQMSNNNTRYSCVMSIWNDTQTLKQLYVKKKIIIINSLLLLVCAVVVLHRMLGALLLFSLFFLFRFLYVAILFWFKTYRSTDNYAVIAGITSIPVNSWAIRTPETTTMKKNILSRTCYFFWYLC